MKITTLLSTSALALLLGMTMSHASDVNPDNPEDIGARVSSAGASAAVGAVADAVADLSVGDADEQDDPHDGTVYDPRDTNHDGNVSLGERWRHHFDADGDGKVAVGEFFGGLWKSVRKLFMSLDSDGDGRVEFEEIAHATHEALDTFEGTVDRIQSLSLKVRALLDMVPENVRTPLTTLLDLVDDIAGHAEKGVDTAKGVHKQVRVALKDLRDQLDSLLDGKVTPQEMNTVLKTVFEYLEMIKGTKITGDNENLVKSLEKKLAHVNKELRKRVIAAKDTTDSL